MSKIKQFYESVTDTVMDAIYHECYNYVSIIESDYWNVYEVVFDAVSSGEFTDIYDGMWQYVISNERNKSPFTRKALDQLDLMMTFQSDTH